MRDEYERHNAVTKDSDPAEVIELLKECCRILNHEDENYIPAIKFAIRFIETDGHMGVKPLVK